MLPPATVQPPEVLPPVPPAPPVTPELPVTGSNSNALLYAALGLVLIGGLGYLFARRPRRRA